jgi:hypothetical protein
MMSLHGRSKYAYYKDSYVATRRCAYEASHDPRIARMDPWNNYLAHECSAQGMTLLTLELPERTPGKQ